jgi:hypothetical protein
MASAAWVGAAVLFVIVAIDQTKYIKESPDFFLETSLASAPASPETAPQPSAGTDAEAPPATKIPVDADGRTRLVAQFAGRRFDLYYLTGGILVGLAWFSSLFLKRRYLKASRWMLVMIFLTGAAGMMAYDYRQVYGQLKVKNEQILKNPQVAEDGQFQTLHEHSKMVNGAQVLLTLLGSLFLCLPGTRPDQPTVLVKRAREEE